MKKQQSYLYWRGATGAPNPWPDAAPYGGLSAVLTGASSHVVMMNDLFVSFILFIVKTQNISQKYHFEADGKSKERFEVLTL